MPDSLSQNGDDLTLGLNIGVQDGDIKQLDVLTEMLERMAEAAEVIERSSKNFGEYISHASVGSTLSNALNGGGTNGARGNTGGAGNAGSPPEQTVTMKKGHSVSRSEAANQQANESKEDSDTNTGEETTQASKPPSRPVQRLTAADEDALSPKPRTSRQATRSEQATEKIVESAEEQTGKEFGGNDPESMSMSQVLKGMKLAQMRQEGMNLSDEDQASLEEWDETFGGDSDLGQIQAFLRSTGTMALGKIGLKGVAGNVSKARGKLGEAGALYNRVRGMGGAAGAVSRLGAGGMVAGAAIGVLSAANEGVQNVGEKYRGMTDIGNVTGDGFMGGVETKARSGILGLDPMISSKEAEKIVNAMTEAGFKNTELDDTTGFAAKQAKDMNLSVSDSVKMLETNVVAGSQSIESLNNQLAKLKEAAQDSNTSLGDMTQQFMKVSDAAVTKGMTGSAGSQLGLMAAEMYQDSGVLEGQGGDVMSKFINSDSQIMMANSQMGNQYGNNPVAVRNRISEDPSVGAELLDKYQGKYIEDAAAIEARSEGQGVMYLQQALGVTTDEAKEYLNLYEENGGGDWNYNSDIADKQMDEANEALEKPSFWDRAKEIGGYAVGSFNGQNISKGITDSDWMKDKLGGLNIDTPDWLLHGNETDATKALIDSTDRDDVKFLIDGEEKSMKDMKPWEWNDSDFEEKLKSGEYKVAIADKETGDFGEYRTMAEQYAAGFAGGPGSVGGGGSSDVNIGLTEEARRIFQVEDISPHQSQANSGQPGTQTNNEPKSAGREK